MMNQVVPDQPVGWIERRETQHLALLRQVLGLDPTYTSIFTHLQKRAAKNNQD
jgi:hypothetical protein